MRWLAFIVAAVAPWLMAPVDVLAFLDQHNGAITAIATLVLALFTLGLWVSTNRLWAETRASSEIAKISAEAARKSAEAIVIAERAYLFIEITAPVGGFVSTIEGCQNLFPVKIWNNGKSPAELVRFRAYAELRSEAPHELIDHPGAEATIPPGLGIAANCADEHFAACHLSNKEIGELERQEKNLYVVGQVVYKDIFGEVRETGFCWFWFHHMQNSRFTIDPYSRLNKRT